ncbi:MAG: hypothetical protein V7K40_27450 [Nostoc sp.]|uniref:hypothetical protein n=1 Tax=Nostoc sp. TaxID=1180 RepID=UPI002FF8BD44
MLNVENKVITITKASSGIGEASARLLAQKGATVVLGTRRIQRKDCRRDPRSRRYSRI